MIKTKDEWERVKVVADSQSGPSLQHAVDTIEALRRFVRASDVVGIPDFALHLADIQELRDSRDALPDWLGKEKLPPLPDPPEPSSVF